MKGASLALSGQRYSAKHDSAALPGSGNDCQRSYEAEMQNSSLSSRCWVPTPTPTPTGGLRQQWLVTAAREGLGDGHATALGRSAFEQAQKCSRKQFRRRVFDGPVLFHVLVSDIGISIRAQGLHQPRNAVQKSHEQACQVRAVECGVSSN